MMTRAITPIMQQFAYLLLTLAFVLLGVATSSAGQTVPSTLSLQGKTSSKEHYTSNPIRQAQRLNNFTPNSSSGGGDHPGKPPGKGKPPGGGISIGIDIIGIINKPGFNPPPRYTPPPGYYPPPKKKVYRKPKTKKKTKTVRRTPRPPSGPAVIQPIPQFIPDQVTVLIQDQPDSVDDALAQTLGLTKLSVTPVSLLEGRLVTFRIPGNRTLPQVIAVLTADPRVSLAQPSNIYLTVGQKSRTTSASKQYSLAKLGLEPVHKISQGRDIPVAVIDTGVDVSHPVLSKAVSRSFDAVGNGMPKAQQHGTAIAGLIAGQGKVKGVAPLSSLLAVRAFYMHPVYKRPVTSSAILIRALDWAFTNKARIFNMSFSGPYDPLVKATLTSAYNKGVILVAAAGNGGPKAAPAYPAAYENVIAITALDHKDKLYTHANRGSYLTAAAPGVDVLVPSLKKGYRYSSGTSLAAALISGLVALLLERYPDASAKAIVEAIKGSAHDLGPKGHDIQFGAGRADAHASLLSMTNSEVKLTSGQ